ncbi:MAG: DNA-directed RNA polymerase subunit beta', partial [Clostridia bacterium]
GTHEGIEVAELVSDGQVIEKLSERLIGRVPAEDVVYEGEVIARRNEMFTKEQIARITELEIKKIKIRSPLTCDLEKGVCQKCYGMDLANHKEILLGEAVGVIAAQSIGEPGTQLTMRTFHTGGVATATAAATSIKAENTGKVVFKDIKLLENQETQEKIVVSQSAKILIGNYDYEIASGSILIVEEGQEVKPGDVLVTFDPYHIPIIANQDGRIEYRELYVKENFDEKYNVTEYMAIKTVESGDSNPRVVIFDEDGTAKESYSIPFGAYLMVREGESVRTGQIIAKIIKEGEGTK